MTDVRQALLAELDAITPLDEHERADIQAARDWAQSGADLCRIAKPATPPQHLIAYFVVTDGHELLLVDHRGAQRWLPAGGHVEPGEHPRTTVQREVHEELGLTLATPPGPPLMISITTTVGSTPGHVDVSLWYLLQVPRDQPLCWDEGEFHGVRWFAPDDLPLQRCDPQLPRFVRKLWPAPKPRPGV